MNPGGVFVDANLQRLKARFESDPSLAAAFEALEEHHFVGGEWNDLVTLYERRLGSPDLDPEKKPKQRAKVAFRLAQVLEERCLEVDRAAEVYESVVRLDPSFQPALLQLRKIYTAQEKWELALQIAEVQAQLPMRPFEQAAFCAEMGEIWHRRLGDVAQAVVLFERALENDPNHVDARLGLAEAQEELGDAQAAARALESAVASLRGPDRAPALVQLARLLDGPLEDPAGAEELYRRARGAGVLFIRTPDDEVPQVTGDEKAESVIAKDLMLHRKVEAPADLVVLAVGMVPDTEATSRLKEILKVPLGADGFFMERHPELGPVETVVDGVFVCGSAMGAKAISDSLSEAGAAAGKAAEIMARSELELEPTIATVDPLRCRGCGTCVEICEFHAPTFTDGAEGVPLVVINEAACKGCGTCVAWCPTGAITARHFTDSQIDTMMETLLQWEAV